MNNKEISKEGKRFLVILDVVCKVQGKCREDHNEDDRSWHHAYTMGYAYSTVLQCTSDTIYENINSWVDSIKNDAILQRLDNDSTGYSYRIIESDVYVNYEKINIIEL